MGYPAQRGIPGLPVDFLLTCHVVGETPGTGEELRRTGGRDVLPVDIVLGRAGESHGESDRVDTVRVDLVPQVHPALALGHFGTAGKHHPLVEQGAERLGEADVAEIEQDLRDEPRVEQVQDGVFDPTDILVDGRPAVRLRRVERPAVVVRVHEPEKIP